MRTAYGEVDALELRESCPVIEKCLILIDKKMGLGKKQHRRSDML